MLVCFLELLRTVAMNDAAACKALYERAEGGGFKSLVQFLSLRLSTR